MPRPRKPDPVRERLDIVKDLIGVFRFERMVYLTITVISFVALIVSALVLLARPKTDILQISMLFGSSGAISYTCARLLKMWGDALRFLLPVVQKEVSDEKP